MNTRDALSRTMTSDCTTTCPASPSHHHTNPFPDTNNTCGAHFRPTPSLLLHVLPSSTPERYRQPAAYVASQSPTMSTYITLVRRICPPASWHLRSPQQWEALSSSRPDLQLRLVTWAEDVAAAFRRRPVWTPQTAA
ncbi:hypothetical protein MRX96_053435 [Rhipicephalus microplus]